MRSSAHVRSQRVPRLAAEGDRDRRFTIPNKVFNKKYSSVYFK
jgi:hypothetical protein